MTKLSALKSIRCHLFRPAKAECVRPSESETRGPETGTLSPPQLLHINGITDRFASGSAWIICSRRRTAFQMSTTAMSHWYFIQENLCYVYVTREEIHTDYVSSTGNVPYLQPSSRA
jgi:hypothetical protein